MDEDGVRIAKKRRVSGGYRRGRYVVRSVDEITQEDLDNIAFRAKDKIWDKDHVSRRGVEPNTHTSGRHGARRF